MLQPAPLRFDKAFLSPSKLRVIDSATLNSDLTPRPLLQNDGLPALVTLKKGLVALARQWMKFIVVTQGFKAIGLMRPNQLPKPKEPLPNLPDLGQGLDNGAALQSDTSADGAEFEFDAGMSRFCGGNKSNSPSPECLLMASLLM